MGDTERKRHRERDTGKRHREETQGKKQRTRDRGVIEGDR
jgi:hypothetical protein